MSQYLDCHHGVALAQVALRFGSHHVQIVRQVVLLLERLDLAHHVSGLRVAVEAGRIEPLQKLEGNCAFVRGVVRSQLSDELDLRNDDDDGDDNDGNDGVTMMTTTMDDGDNNDCGDDDYKDDNDDDGGDDSDNDKVI